MRIQKTEVRRQETEVRRQKTGVRRQKTEDRRRNADIGTQALLPCWFFVPEAGVTGMIGCLLSLNLKIQLIFQKISYKKVIIINGA